MGTKKNEGTAEAPVQEEAQYTIDEFVAATKAVFGAGTSPDIVRAALRKAGKERYSIPEAKKLVEAFAKKEVK